MALPAPTLEQSIDFLYARRTALSEALAHDDPDPVAVHEAADDLAPCTFLIYPPAVREMAVAALIEAAYDAPNKPTRLIVLKTVEEVLKGFTSGRLIWTADDGGDDGGGETRDAANGGNDNAAEATPSPASEADQRAA